MSYDEWKTAEPEREPAPGEHRPGDEACECAECELARADECPECHGERWVTHAEVIRGELVETETRCGRCGDDDDREPTDPSSSTDRTGLPEAPR